MNRYSPWSCLEDNIQKVDKNFYSLSLKDRISTIRNIQPSKDIKSFRDPFLIKDMDIAVNDIINKINSHKRIIISGDYDCDGVFSTLSLYNFLKSIGADCDFYIPNRFTDGYGLSINATYDIIALNYDLVITVDSGISFMEQVDLLSNAGIDIIITDHHNCPEEIPKCLAVLDCKRKDNTYPFNELCGAGIVLKLIQALCKTLNLDDNIWKQYVKYIAIATVADVVPLIDENKLIVTNGLEDLHETNDCALNSLASVSKKSIKSLNSIDLGFVLAPKINVASRMDEFNTVLDLFLSKDKNKIISLAERLSELNQSRKQIEKEIFDEAILQVIKEHDFTKCYPIVVYNENWISGVVGIVAARLCDYFKAPVVILSSPDGKDYVGSCRSFSDINMYELLKNTSSILKRFGGHSKAAGLALKKENLEEFKQQIKNSMKKLYPEIYNFNLSNKTSLIADSYVSLSDFTTKNILEVNTLGPFGAENPEPVFIAKNLVIKNIDFLGKEKKHLKLFVNDSSTKKTGQLLFFNEIDLFNILKIGDKIDVLGSLSLNTWQNKTTTQFIVKDIHIHKISQNIYEYEFENQAYLEGTTNMSDLCNNLHYKKDKLLPVKQDFNIVFYAIDNLISKNILCSCKAFFELLKSSFSEEKYIDNFTLFKMFRILEVLDEAGYIYFRNIDENNIFITINNTSDKIPLSQTLAYKKMIEIKEPCG